MKIPTLPTDNFYKFIAFLGVLVQLLPLLYYCITIEKHLTKLYDFRVEKALIEKENEFIKEDIDLLEKAKEDLIPSNNDSKNEKHNRTVKEVIEKRRELIRRNIRLQALDLQASIYENRINLFSIAYKGGLVVGIPLTLLGCYGWYFKQQIYQDEIVKKKAERREGE